MTGQEQIIEDIKDKARGFCNTQTKVIVRTIPSTKYPKGAKYEGYVFDVLNNIIVFNDTWKDESKPYRIYIYISEIASPADIYKKEEIYDG